MTIPHPRVTTVPSRSRVVVAVIIGVLLLMAMVWFAARLVYKTDAPEPAPAVPTSPQQLTDDPTLREGELTLKDGRVITCIIHRADNGRGGLSCDWPSANRGN